MLLGIAIALFICCICPMIGHDWSAQKITLDIDKAHERQWLINNITEFKGYIEQGLGDTEQHARFVAEYEEKLARLS